MEVGAINANFIFIHFHAKLYNEFLYKKFE